MIVVTMVVMIEMEVVMGTEAEVTESVSEDMDMDTE